MIDLVTITVVISFIHRIYFKFVSHVGKKWDSKKQNIQEFSKIDAHNFKIALLPVFRIISPISPIFFLKKSWKSHNSPIFISQNFLLVLSWEPNETHQFALVNKQICKNECEDGLFIKLDSEKFNRYLFKVMS